MEKQQHSSVSQQPMWRWIGGLGVAYSVLYLIGALALAGSPPSISASTAQLTTYYTSHRTTVTASVFVIATAMVVFAFFSAALRRALAQSHPDADRLSTVATVGTAVYIGGLLLSGVLQFALIDGAHHHQLATLQAVNTLSQDDFIPVVCGLSILALATGITGLRYRSLPRWLACASIGLGVLALAGPLGAIAFLLTPVWTLAVGVVLARRRDLASPADVSSQTAPDTQRV